MKTKKILLSGLILICSLILNESCKDHSSDCPGDPSKPGLTVTGVNASPLDVNPGTVLNFVIAATANACTNKDLNTINFHLQYSPSGTSLDTTWNAGANEKTLFQVNKSYTIPATAKNNDVITITISTKDITNASASVIWVLNVKVIQDLVKPSLSVTHDNWGAGNQVQPGTKWVFNIQANANPNTKKDINQMIFAATFSTQPSSNTSTTWGQGGIAFGASEKQQVNRIDTFKVPSGTPDGCVITITITANDKDAKAAVPVVYTLTVKDLSGTLIFRNIILGSNNNVTVGSFFCTGRTDGSGNIIDKDSVYNLTAAFNNQTKIDLCYFYDISLGHAASLAAPVENTMVPSKFSNATYGVGKWTVRNSTVMRKIDTMSSTRYDALTSSDLQGIYNSAASNPHPNYVDALSDTQGGMQPSFIAFKNYLGKYGIIRVEYIDIMNMDAGTIIITIKIQK